MSTNEAALVQMEEQFASLAISRHPNAVLAEAVQAANAIKSVIDKKTKKVIFNGEVYVENEDWITLARFYGVTARIKSTNYAEFGNVKGFESTAEAYLVSTGQVIGTADSMCLNDEENWGLRSKYEWVDGPNGKRVKNKIGDVPVPLFQLRSMAQTRASSKVLSLLFKWVVVLAGFRPTPAEEVDERTIDAQPEDSSPEIRRPQRKEAKAETKETPQDPDCITKPQGSRLYAICKQLKLSDDEIKSEMKRLLKDKAGNPLEHTRDMLKKDYEGFIDSVDPSFKHHEKPKGATDSGDKSGKFDRDNF